MRKERNGTLVVIGRVTKLPPTLIIVRGGVGVGGRIIEEPPVDVAAQVRVVAVDSLCEQEVVSHPMIVSDWEVGMQLPQRVEGVNRASW